MSRLLLLALFSIVLSACGSKGALYLENKQSETKKVESSKQQKLKVDDQILIKEKQNKDQPIKESTDK